MIRSAAGSRRSKETSPTSSYFPPDELQRALGQVAVYPVAELASLVQVLDGYAAFAQQRWAAWRRKQQFEDRPPAVLADVRDAVS